MWSNQEISDFQVSNNKRLAEVNATLRPDAGLSNECVGVMAPGQAGDLMTAMSVLKYREEIFGDKRIIWFSNSPNCDCLKYAPISEVRPWPWAGAGLPKGHPDYWPYLMTEDNRLNKELAKQFKDTADLSEAFFPVPYMLTPTQRHGIEYPNVSKKVFAVPDDWEWHPVLNFSRGEELMADEFLSKMDSGRKILIESFAGSGQSKLDAEMIEMSMNLCKQYWGDCNFIFASHKFLRDTEKFPEYLFEQPGVFSCANFTVRQCALIADKCDLMLSVSSGITVAASCWRNAESMPILQFCGSDVCSTKNLSTGHFELVTHDEKPFEQAKEEFYSKLIELLKIY